MINVMVCSRKEAERAKLHDGVAVISIFTPGDTPADIKHHPDQVLPICFHDLSDPKLDGKTIVYLGKVDDTAPRAMNLCSAEQAREILAFVDNMIARGITNFVIHCDAGISRSPGVAVALKQIYNDDREIPYHYQLFNRWVYTRILEAKFMTPIPHEVNLTKHDIRYTC